MTPTDQRIALDAARLSALQAEYGFTLPGGDGRQWRPLRERPRGYITGLPSLGHLEGLATDGTVAVFRNLTTDICCIFHITHFVEDKPDVAPERAAASPRRRAALYASI